MTTATVSPVKLTFDGLELAIPTTFTGDVGLLTIQAKNPLAETGDAIGIYVIETPVLGSLSPSSIPVTEAPNSIGVYVVPGNTITVTATKLPSDLSLCRVGVVKNVSAELGAPADVTEPSVASGGFTFSVTDIQFTGVHNVSLSCGGVTSNTKTLDFPLAN